ncbi:MAG: fatty acid desaturase [Planctomycetaceae bacterium]|jgi:fatty acid desaturase|nr:fatty acid desaturase [Planctomycetaceae bacterium]
MVAGCKSSPQTSATGLESTDGHADATAGSAWIREARQAIRDADVDYFRVSPARYWIDFLVSLTAAYLASAVYLTVPLWSWRQAVAFPIAAFWLYRLGSLIHEVCHLGGHELPAFKAAWNALAGVMLLTPSPFFTRHHRDHHSQRYYGTPEDPEYVANVLEGGNPRSMAGYVVYVLAFPLLVFLRFLLAPLTFLHPQLREWTLRKASSLTFNRAYERRLTASDRWAILAAEIPCFLRAALIPTLVLLGLNHWSRIPLLYVLAVATVVLNQLRQLADHHFAGDGSRVELEAHIVDSCNFTRNDPLTLLFFPFSIRYHALHHLFPSMPYHNLKPAHAHLVATLPPDSPYHGLDRPGWWSVAKVTMFGDWAALRRA